MKLFKAAKIHVQIMRFACCLNMVFNLIKPKRGPDIFAFNVTRESIVALTGQFADAFVCKKLCHLVYDLVMYGCF